jgi:hypothetical protein
MEKKTLDISLKHLHTNYKDVLKRQQEHFDIQRFIVTDCYCNSMVTRGRLTICGSLW